MIKKVIKLSIFIILICSISSCSTFMKKEEKIKSINDNNINLTDLSNYDLQSLDKKNYLINLNSYNNEPINKKRVGIIFITDELKQKKISINIINLKYWLKNELIKHKYSIERINEQLPIVILVEYGITPLSDKKYENNFDSLLFKKTLKIRAINYLKFKEKQKIDVYWSGEITLIGPSIDLTHSLAILGNFINDVLEKNINNKKMIIPKNDPKLELTKDVPSSIFVDDLKPTVEELEFFN